MIIPKRKDQGHKTVWYKTVIPKQNKNLAGKHQVLQLCVQHLGGACKVMWGSKALE